MFEQAFACYDVKKFHMKLKDIMNEVSTTLILAVYRVTIAIVIVILIRKIF